MKEQLDVAVLIALDEEFEEFFSLLPITPTPVPIKYHGGFDFRFRAPTSNGSDYYGVAHLIGEMGPEDARGAAERFLARWNCETAMMIGIAASLDSDIVIGDVVVGKQIDGYATNLKASPKGKTFKLLHSGSVYRSDYELLEHLKDLPFSHPEFFENWRQNCGNDLNEMLKRTQLRKLIKNRILRNTPELYRGDLASGPAVGAAKAFSEWLKVKNRKYAALEMESVGLAAAAQNRSLPIRTLVLRGISDYGDERKKGLDEIGGGVLRRYAMRNAIRLFLVLLELGVFRRSRYLGQQRRKPSLPGLTDSTEWRWLAFDSDQLRIMIQGFTKMHDIDRRILDRIGEFIVEVIGRILGFDVAYSGPREGAHIVSENRDWSQAPRTGPRLYTLRNVFNPLDRITVRTVIDYRLRHLQVVVGEAGAISTDEEFSLTDATGFANVTFRKVHIVVRSGNVEHSNRLHEAHETLQSVLAQNDDNVIGHVVEFFRGYFSHFANEIYSCIRERAPEEIEIGDVLPAIADTDGFLHYLYGEEAMREKVARVSMRIHRPLERILRALAMYANYEQSMTGRVENSRENGFVDIDLTEGKYKWETRKAEEEIYAGRTIRVIRLNQRDRPYTVAVLAPHGDVAEIVTRIASDRSFRDHIERIAERHIKELRTINSNLRRAGWVPDLFEGS